MPCTCFPSSRIRSLPRPDVHRRRRDVASSSIERRCAIALFGYIPILKQFLASRQSPNILEVGIDRGTTLLPLTTFLAHYCPTPYRYMGVDIEVQESLRQTVKYMDDPIPQSTFLVQRNSLDFLPHAVDMNQRFDLILLDGDHNYHTVSQELPLVQQLLKDDGILLIDDYQGRWADRDLWYSTRPGYETNELATKPVEGEKHGVRTAVDDWLLKNPQLRRYSPLQGEPLLVTSLSIPQFENKAG